MQWLTALLAFAVTMLMFAIVVSILVEIHRDMNLRAQGMQLMLESLYSHVDLPKLSKAGGNDAKLLQTLEYRSHENAI